ncbi:hypothetical protein ACH5RR_003702 [Cinchona calisaya]|uniref:Uncharacterized protein n=1 Tax=Cinchona calisaya TaxID=153742 RepID=A0ABD3AVK3_9GENT
MGKEREVAGKVGAVGEGGIDNAGKNRCKKDGKDDDVDLMWIEGKKALELMRDSVRDTSEDKENRSDEPNKESLGKNSQLKQKRNESGSLKRWQGENHSMRLNVGT